MEHAPKYFLTELNDGIQWLTDGQGFGINPAAVPALLEALERALTTTQEIERVIGQRHYNAGTLQKMADAIQAAKVTGTPESGPSDCDCDCQNPSDEEDYATYEHDKDFPECYGISKEA